LIQINRMTLPQAKSSTLPFRKIEAMRQIIHKKIWASIISFCSLKGVIIRWQTMKLKPVWFIGLLFSVFCCSDIYLFEFHINCKFRCILPNITITDSLPFRGLGCTVQILKWLPKPFWFWRNTCKRIENAWSSRREQGVRMVSFKGDKGFMYKANLSLRTALKILKPIYFKARDEQGL
jgi:hypothetical protein